MRSIVHSHDHGIPRIHHQILLSVRPEGVISGQQWADRPLWNTVFCDIGVVDVLQACRCCTCGIVVLACHGIIREAVDVESSAPSGGIATGASRPKSIGNPAGGIELHFHERGTWMLRADGWVND